MSALDHSHASCPSADVTARSRFSAGHLRLHRERDGHGHGHGDDHGGHSHGLGGHATATGKHRRKLVWVLGITLAVFVVQVVGAIVSGSLALLADAGHMLTDAAGVTIALAASLVASRPSSQRRTFGYQRAEVLAAMVNGIVLAVIAIVIFVEAVRRFGSSPDIATGPMLAAAVAGAVANLVSLLILHSGQKESLNVRGAYLEVLGDLLGSLAVIVAGVIIWTTGWTAADQVASIAIAMLILPRAWSLLSEVVHVLMEAAPKEIDLAEARDHLLTVDGVEEVHDVHAWTITSGVPVFSAHVVVGGHLVSGEVGSILDELDACLEEHFETLHTTFQVEPSAHARHEEALHP